MAAAARYAYLAKLLNVNVVGNPIYATLLALTFRADKTFLYTGDLDLWQRHHIQKSIIWAIVEEGESRNLRTT